MNNKTKVLFLGKTDNPFVLQALNYCKENFEHLTYALGALKEPMPEEVLSWKGDYIISFLCYWILPQQILDRASIAAINFHPASPQYPGIGCYNFALYDEAKSYGATCHHMLSKVDSGEIIQTKSFPLENRDNVESLITKTYNHLIPLFQEVVNIIIHDHSLPTSNEQWIGKAKTRKELNQLSKLTPDMSKEEMERRIRATSYKKWKPTLEIHGRTFVLK